MKNAIIATGNEIIAKKLLNFANEYMKKYKIKFSEGIEMAMRNIEIWKGYENLI